MKNQIKKTTIKQLANHFDEELQTNLPVTKLPNGSYAFNNFVITQMPNKNWALYCAISKTRLNEYFLISCALIAAHEYAAHRFDKYINIKHIDTRYQSAYTDLLVFKHNINLTNDQDQKDIFLTRLSESKSSALYYKKTILRLFRNTFV